VLRTLSRKHFLEGIRLDDETPIEFLGSRHDIVENTFHKYIERKHILEGIRIDDETPVEFLGGARV